MKKTLNINIGNSIFHLEEDAFEHLTSYLIEVKQHFGKSADDFEIVSDIENRIAEMFTEMLETQGKQVIELGDVETVIALMGSVKDFEEQPETTDYSAEYANRPGERKIYRDTEDGMVAGVCSGLSHYMNIDVSILRIVAVLTVLLGGSGFIAYLILWIAIPKALSRADKMAMKGEAVNLQGFKKNFEEELSSLHGNLRNAGDHLQPMMKRSGTFATEFVEVLGNFMKGTGRSIFKFIAIVIVIAGSLALLAGLIAIAAMLGFYDASISQVFPMSIVDASYFSTFIIAAAIVFIIPLVGLILFSVRVAFNTAAINKTISYGLLLIWLAGVSVGIFYVAKTVTEFKEEAEFTQNIPLKTYPEYTLSLNKAMFFTKADSLRYQLDGADNTGKIIQNGGSDHFSMPKNVRIVIERSGDNESLITKGYRSSGVNFETALYQAKNIQYDFLQKDSLLTFSPQLHLKTKANWRDQRIEIVLRVPVGTRLNIDRELDRYIQNYSLWSCDTEDDNDNDNHELPYKGIMTTEGLKCR